MSEFDAEKAIDWGSYLASLDKPARNEAVAAARTALSAGLPVDEADPPKSRPLGEYLDDKIELPPMLVEPGCVARGAISVLTSRGGKGKTAISLNRLMRWAMGKPLFDERPDIWKAVKPLRILLIENEGAPGHFQETLQTILNVNGADGHERDLARENLHIWGNGGWSGLKLDDPGDIADVRRECERIKPDILFAEPFRGLWKGSEIDDQAMSNVLDEFSSIANDFNLGVLLTHHERKAPLEGQDPMGAVRGSTVFEGHAAVMERWVPVRGHDQRELSCIKNRFTPDHAGTVRMEFVPDEWGYRFVGDHEKMQGIVDVLRALGSEEYVSIASISDESGETYHAVRSQLDKAVAEGYAKKRAQEGKVQYRFVSTGDDPGDHDSLTIT